MIIRCWGARGSLAVSGKEYIRYGGNTPCIDIRTRDGETIIIDAGTGIRKLGNVLLDDKNFSYTMLFTHVHWDHIMGFPFFKPIYHNRTNINIIGCQNAETGIKEVLTKTMSSPYFPIEFDDVNATFNITNDCPINFNIGSVNITRIALSHPNGGYGYRFEEDGKSFVFLTDNELNHEHPGGQSTQQYIDFSKDADFLIHDSEYRPEEYKHTKGWGHTVYIDALNLAIEAGAKRFGLYHHNVERTDDDLDDIVKDCAERLKEAGSTMECFGMTENFTLEL